MSNTTNSPAGTTCNPDWETSNFSFYRYVPSLAAAVLFCVLFCFSTILHAWQTWKTRAWFTIPVVIGFGFEFIGYAARSSSARQEPGCWRLMPYIVQNIYILLGPALVAASVYMALGRIILLVDGEHLLLSLRIRRRLLTRVFVIGDVACFTMQSGGGGLSAAGSRITSPETSSTLVKVGTNLITAGLILQLVWFLIFVAIAIIFHLRMRRTPTTLSFQPEINARWESHLHTLYLVSGLIVLRSAFRAAEFIQGHQGYLLSNEVFLYLFDALPMFVAAVWLNWRHMGEMAVLLRGERVDGDSDVFRLMGLRMGVEGGGKV